MRSFLILVTLSLAACSHKANDQIQPQTQPQNNPDTKQYSEFFRQEIPGRALSDEKNARYLMTVADRMIPAGQDKMEYHVSFSLSLYEKGTFELIYSVVRWNSETKSWLTQLDYKIMGLWHRSDDKLILKDVGTIEYAVIDKERGVSLRLQGDEYEPATLGTLNPVILFYREGHSGYPTAPKRAGH